MDTLNNRGKKILKAFLNNDLLTSEQLSELLDISKKTLYKELDILNHTLEAFEARIVRKQRVGMWLEVSQGGNALEKLLDKQDSDRLSSGDARKYYLIVRLLEHDGYLRSEDLAEEIFVSHTTLVNDLRKVDTWLKEKGITLERRRAKGLRVNVNEKKRREILAGIYQNHKSDHEMLEMVRELRLNHDERTIEHYIGSAIFKRFDAFDLDTLRLIVRNLEEKTTIRFSDEGFAALVIHIAIALKRVMDGNVVELDRNTVERLQQHDAYPDAKDFIHRIESYFNVTMPEDEACYILMHMLGAKVQEEPNALDQAFPKEILDTVKAIIRRSESLLDVSLIKDEILIKSLALHIQSSINRLENDLPIKNPYLQDMKSEYPMVFEASIEGYETLRSRYGFPYNDHEIAYIAMHVQAAIERSGKPSKEKQNVLIVCSSGVGTSQLLTSKFKRVFKGLNVIDTVSLLETDTYDMKDIDLVVTTVPLENPSVMSVHVSPFLNERDITKVENALDVARESHADTNSSPFQGFTHLLDSKLLRTHVRHTDYRRLIRDMCTVLEEEGSVTEDFYQSVIDREKISSTAVFNVAIPHGDYNHVLEDHMMVWTLKNPINWEEDKVKTVILLAIRKETTKNLKTFYDTLYDVIGDENMRQRIESVKDSETLYTLLSKGD